ncbi:MAG: hypothetical protein Q9167_004466 [Letrouitia subvulpina]
MGLVMDLEAPEAVKLSRAIVSSSSKWRISELSALNNRLLRSEASKTGLAPSNTMVLAEWGSILLQHCAVEVGAWAAQGIELVEAHTRVLDLCLSFAKRSSIKRSALVVTWRAFHSLFKDLNNGKARVRAIVDTFTAKSQSLGIKSACLLGAVARVCARVPSLRSVLEPTKTNYFSFYVQEIVGSRTTVPQHYVDSMNNFFSHFVSLEDLHRDLVPAFERALLRAPEVVLNNILAPMIHSLPPDVDLAEALATRLLKPLLSNVRSTNAKIRDGAVSAFTALIAHSCKLEYIEKVAEEVLVPLSTAKLASADHRTAHSKMLASLPFLPLYSALICKSMSVVTSKESNEAALSAEVSAIVHHLLSVLKHSNEIDSSVLKTARDAFARGISDKKLQLRRIWVLEAGDFLWQMQELSTGLNSKNIKRMCPIVEAIVSKLIDVSEEMTSNVQSAGQSGLALAGYILLACFGFLSDFVTDGEIKSALRKAPIRKQSVYPKASFLLNHRVYTRLPEHQYYTWAVRALVSFVVEQAENDGSLVVGDAWGQAFIFLTTAADIIPSTRKEAAAALTQIYLQHPPPVARSIINALWTWTEHLATSQQDTAASASKSDSSRLGSVIQAICLDGASINSREKVVQILPDQMISLLVLCRPEILPGTNWIELCLKVGQDPGELARNRGNDCVAEIETILNASVNRPKMELVKLAACKAAAELAFVAPEIMTPLFVKQIRGLLEVEKIRSSGPTEIAIMRTVEGIAFVDVLNDKTQSIDFDKKSRDYETLKWESEVRRQLAQKKGQERKLTADEKAKVDAQLKREAEIRKEMRNLESQLIKGVGLIDALATGPPTDALLWMGECTKALLEAIDAGAGLLIAGLADSAYINCAKIISPRLGSLRQFIGIGTLRALGSSNLPNDMEQEPVGGK